MSEQDDIKNKVTARELRYEKKNQDPITVPNFTNFVVTTNNEVTLRVSHDDRRLVFFRCSDHRRGDKDYFATLCTAMARPGAGRALYQYFMDRNLAKYVNAMSFQVLRPITSYYREVRAESVKPEIAFFSGLVNAYDHATGVVRFNITDLYASYKQYMTEGGQADKIVHCTAFGRQLNKLMGSTMQQANNGFARGHKIYPLNIATLRELLVRNCLYDEEIGLTSPPKPHTTAALL